MQGLTRLIGGQPGMIPSVAGQRGSPGDSKKGARWRDIRGGVLGHGVAVLTNEVERYFTVFTTSVTVWDRAG